MTRIKIGSQRSILNASPHIGVIVLTVFEDDDAVFAAMRAGARGYILKGADQAELLRAIQRPGEALFSPGIARRLVLFLPSAQDPPRSSRVDGFARF
jgi:DNA-binding NarL/FixJ family response regulator